MILAEKLAAGVAAQVRFAVPLFFSLLLVGKQLHARLNGERGH